MLKSINRACHEVISMGPLMLQRAAKAGWGHHPETVRTRGTVGIKRLLLWFVCTCACACVCTYISVAMRYSPRHLAKVGQTPSRTELTVEKTEKQICTAFLCLCVHKCRKNKYSTKCTWTRPLWSHFLSPDRRSNLHREVKKKKKTTTVMYCVSSDPRADSISYLWYKSTRRCKSTAYFTL